MVPHKIIVTVVFQQDGAALQLFGGGGPTFQNRELDHYSYFFYVAYEMVILPKEDFDFGQFT